MSWKTKGIDDGRKANDYEEPKRDIVNKIAGYTEKDEKEWKKDYNDGYKIGTSQRVADSNYDSDSSSSSDGGSGK